MLSPRLTVAVLISFLLAGASSRADEHELFVDTPDSTTEPLEGGGLFDGLFGGGGPLSKFKGRLIDTLGRAHLDRSPAAAPPYQSGLLLARREAFGPDMVPVPIADVERLGEKIVTRLLDSAQIRGLAPKVVVLAAEAIHGEALPDGTIFITLGAVRNIDTIDAFGALLAHEVAHIILNHHDSDWFLESQERGLAVIELVLAAKESVEKALGSSNDSKEALKIRLIANAVVFASDVFIDSAFTRAQEDEADILASDLLVKAGFNLEGLSALLEMMADQEKLAFEAAERREAERRRAFGEKLEHKGGAGLLQSIFEVAGEAFRSLSHDLRQSFGKRHRAAEERREMVVRYWDREYQNVDAFSAERDEWAVLRKQRKLTAVLGAYRDVLRARFAITTQELDGVVESLGQALRILPEDHALPRVVAAELSAAAGDPARAELYFQQSLRGRNPPLSAYAGLLELRRTMPRSDGVTEILARAQADLKEPPQLLPDRIAYLRGTRRGSGKAAEIEVNALMADCKLSAIMSLFKQCSRAAEGNFGRLPPSLRDRRDLDLAGLSMGDIRMVRIVPPRVNARSGPGTSFGVVAAFKQGTTLMVLDVKGKWQQVRDRQGLVGWVAGRLTTNAPGAHKQFFVGGKARKLSRRSPRPPNKVPPSVWSGKKATPAPGGRKVADRLRDLKALREEELIDEAEYREKRKQILREL